MEVVDRKADNAGDKGQRPVPAQRVVQQQLTLRTWLALLALGLSLWFIITYSDFLMELLWIVFGAVLISVGVRALAGRLQREWLPYSVAVTALFLGGLLALVVPAVLLVPVVKHEALLLRQTLGQSAAGTAAGSPLAFLPSAGVLLQDLGQRLDTVVASALGTVTGLSKLLVDLTVMIFLAYFLNVGVGAEEEWFLRWLPQGQREATARFVERVRGRLARWILAQAALGLYFALTVTAGLLLLGVPYALTIGVVAGLLGLIPYAGAAVAAVLAGVSALSISPQTALWSIVLILILSSLALHVIAPLLYGRTLRLPVAAILLALLLGARLLGLAGIFFAAPAAVVLLALVEERAAGRTGGGTTDETGPLPAGSTKFKEDTIQ